MPGRESKVFNVSGPTPPLGIEFEETGTALYVRISNAQVAVTKEVEDDVLADYDAKGNLVGFEIIGLEPGRSATVLARIKAGFQSKAPSLNLLDSLVATH